MTHVSFEYTLRKSRRARNMRLVVYPDGAVVVTVPQRAVSSMVEGFIQKYKAWVERKIVETRGRSILRVVRKDIPKLKREAYALAEVRCAHFAQLYGFAHGEIAIRSQKTRWGSCSHNGNLAFNYKVALLPSPLADYIFVHEICHLGELNHSKQFWGLVGRIVPDHKERRRALRAIATVYA